MSTLAPQNISLIVYEILDHSNILRPVWYSVYLFPFVSFFVLSKTYWENDESLNWLRRPNNSSNQLKTYQNLNCTVYLSKLVIKYTHIKIFLPWSWISFVNIEFWALTVWWNTRFEALVVFDTSAQINLLKRIILSKTFSVQILAFVLWTILWIDV